MARPEDENISVPLALTGPYSWFLANCRGQDIVLTSLLNGDRKTIRLSLVLVDISWGPAYYSDRRLRGGLTQCFLLGQPFRDQSYYSGQKIIMVVLRIKVTQVREIQYIFNLNDSSER